VIAPVLEASGARRVVEIGALRGETTVKIVNDLGPEGELHVIDPVPQFDPTEHERRFPGRYIFHRDLSHNVLPGLPAMDVALIDGDHNWYTVFNELRMLAETADAAGAPLPVLVMHDVGWPYGRRDLYYEPDRIPEEYRQPYAQRGIKRGESELLERGGFNPLMHNALTEGGPRNGVMTALDDFVAERERELRIVVLPLYHGLAVVADRERLAGNPELTDVLDRMGTPKFLRDMLRLLENLRLREVQWAQALYYSADERRDRAAARYLKLLEADLPAGERRPEQLESCLETVREELVGGALVACGTREAAVPIFLCGSVEAYEMPDREVWLAAIGEPEATRTALERMDPPDGRVHLVDESPPAAAIEKIAVLQIGEQADVAEVLNALYDRVTLGGFVLVDGYQVPERREAVDAFRAARAEEPLEQEKNGACWRRLR
jgi:hypothetical protein